LPHCPTVALRLSGFSADDRTEANGDPQVVRINATDDRWRSYYERAAALRAVTGDPFKRHIRRETLRERVVLISSSLLVLGLVAAAFYLLTCQ
jgi:hypothetical protein